MEASFFTGNRRRLLAMLGEEETVLVCFSGLPRRRTADEDYPFYANRSFVYLTGLEQANLVYLAWRKNGQSHETLFLPKTDPLLERWHGRMLRPEEARARSGIGEIARRDGFDGVLARLISSMSYPSLWLDFDPPGPGQPPEIAQSFARDMVGRYPHCSLHSCHPLLQRLRTRKQPEEIAQLRRSIDLTGEGIAAMLRACRPGVYEYQLRAVFEKVLADHGARTPAFDTIVAAGKNALVMHYPQQDAMARDGEMVLVDLGAQCGCCGADISRVFPVGGRFTPRQRQLHGASVATIDELCRRLTPGMSMDDIDPMADAYLFEHLRPMGLADRPEQVRDYRWHKTSHHLGFDTHDDNDYTLPLAPGMVFTMEVGIYVPQWGEGVRIEDDILMTESGCENLSLAIPRTAEEMEAAMGPR